MQSPVRVWARAAVAALCVVALARPAAATTSLFIASDPGDPVGRGRHRVFSPPAFILSGSSFGAQVTLNLSSPQYEDGWTLSFAAPAGTPLVPGIYENAQAYGIQNFDRPGLAVSSYGANCSRISGRFEVLAAVFGQFGEVREFVATFEQHCESALPKLRGLVRFAAGDVACTGAADGTACEDHDACTQAATCVAGQCVGTGVPACVPAGSECEDPGVCDPTGGACLAPSTRPDGAVCDDRDACTLDDRCHDGVCGGSNFTYCQTDNDPCTEDLCEPTLGCVSRPASGVCGRPGVPSTSFFAQFDGDTTFGGQRQVSVTSADGEFSLTQSPGQPVTITPPSGYQGLYLGVTLGAPGGQRLQPGTYEPTSESYSYPPASSGPILSVSGLGYCSTSRSGSFTVREADYSPGGRLIGLAADFRMQCPGTGGAVHGSVRYRAGDATCHDALDGTPCDDRNECTTGSRCRAGACVSAAATACAPGGTCRQPGVCDPASGACLSPVPQAEQTACRDDAACIPSGFCHDGQCTSFGSACNDGDFCTDDRCEAGQCISHPVDGRCWTLDGSVTIQWVSAGTRCACTERAISAPLVLSNDGSYRTLIHAASCGATVETGTWSRKRKGQLKFAPGNDQAELAGSCLGSGGGDLKKYASSGNLPKRGALKLRRVRKYTVDEPRQIAVTIVSRLKGHPTGSAQLPDDVATPPVTERCQEMLQTCLFGRRPIEPTE